MAMNVILELNGVTGESKLDGFEGQIDIDSFAWGVSNSAAAHTGGGASGGGIGNMSDLSLSKFTDAASPILANYCYSGDHIDTGTLHVFESGGQQNVEYIKFDMTEIYVTSINFSGHGASGQKPNESLTLAFSKVEYTYTVQSETGGKAAEPKVTIDAKKGKSST
jgi:type VI secretion system secreted protein Hcp